jgi:NAD(P)-dependent dehydrogenase (short-subunit alcohol dehydrogenase family)
VGGLPAFSQACALLLRRQAEENPLVSALGTLVVTGASRGIGAATAQLAAAHGYAVAVNYATDAASAAAVVAAIEAGGGRAHAFPGDVARETDVVELFARAEAELGPLAALVNNAGITGGSSLVADLSREALERTLAVNVTGAFLCAREAVRRLARSRGGSGGAIVNVSSRAAGLGGGGEWVHYAASKGAVETFTRGLAIEVAREGIRVNAVAPGLIETDIHAAAGRPGRLAELAPGVPLARAGTPGEVAAAIVWLLSPAASYVTGAVLEVAGGR